MRKRLMFGSAVVLLGILVTLVVWQGSFNLSPAPSTIQQTYLFWAVSTFIFILTVTLGFNLLRTVVKLYIERQSNRPGSHIKSKLIGGALALSVLPIIFLVLWSVSVLNRNLDKWFSRPAETMNIDLRQISNALDQEVHDKLTAQAHWLAAQPAESADFYERFCQENQIEKAEIQHADGGNRVVCSVSGTHQGDLYNAGISTAEGKLVLSARMPLELAAKQREINQAIADYDRLSVDKKAYRRLYLLLLSLITLFVLFFAIWIARYMAGQISTPITALLLAAEQIRKGNLSYRVRVGAIDEMATLVRAFNEMTEALETNSRELEARRRFTEAILESIPTGVISLTSDGRIQRVNRALLGIFPEEQVARASRLSDLFSREDTAEIRYLMNRARRTASAATQIEYKAERRVLQLALTVAALDEQRSSGFVLVVEDTSELLRAQKAEAWHEVARRVAHEIKNPLTPIALCADRIAWQLARPEQTSDTRRILHECSATIAREVETVRTLVDEFSQFTRFPAAQPVPSDLNHVVDNALSVFDGRLDGIRVEKDLAAGLPPVHVDREQFKRVVVNLVDNAAEAMQESLVKRLYIGTRFTEADSVELVIADTGGGVSREDKAKLFLPYFSTKGRGTGLGLAIVNRILADHDATIRVEDNVPTGARFVVDLPVRPAAETDPKAAEMPAAEIRSVKPAQILIVDDEPLIRQSLAGVLEDEGYQTHAVSTGEECCAEIARTPYDLILLDVWLPGMDGLETLSRLQEIAFAIRPVVVIISGHGTIETAVKATKLGAFDFLEKPLTIEKVMVVVKNALQQRKLELEVERLKEDGRRELEIIGESVPMKALRQQLALMAATNGRVLIYGESGSGKELVAHAIHNSSQRGAEAFVEVNCAAIPEDLIESELFGHRKGSFPGATEDKTGKLQKADGGTLFLDEVGDMSLKTQAKVLRSLEEQRFEPVGAETSIQVDVRVVAATNKNLEEEIERGNFREDLFYRLNVIPFYVPPLRDRVEDIPLLANHFLKEFTTAYGRRPKELTPEAYEVLKEHRWPGNVRELRNLMERIVIMSPQIRVDARHIPLIPGKRAVFERAAERLGSLHEVRAAAEREYILKTLDETKGNVTKTAELLGLERSNLYRKMKALGIGPKE